RMHPLFELAPAAQDVGAAVGAATLLIAGTIGLAVTDLKRVIAYSTMSQIGYMIMGVSVGAYAAGLFHLMTHAFFKALLFMAAGSLIGAMAGEQVAEARELEGGHLHHAEVPTNPATGEAEDTDVGFPGPIHAIAERALPMRVAMGVLALGALGAGLVQIPKVDFVIDDFLRPSF